MRKIYYFKSHYFLNYHKLHDLKFKTRAENSANFAKFQVDATAWKIYWWTLIECQNSYRINLIFLGEFKPKFKIKSQYF